MAAKVRSEQRQRLARNAAAAAATTQPVGATPVDNTTDASSEHPTIGSVRKPKLLESWDSTIPPTDFARHELELEKLFTYREIAYLRSSPSPVLATAHRITRAVTTRGKAAKWPAPPPIVSRIYQELSNGLLAYHQATKMKEVPVPFAYVQFNALLLNAFNIVCPIAVATLTGNVVFSVIAASLINGGFTALWLVANELEDPFGTDYNDLPMLQYHETYVGSIRALLRWLDEDSWAHVGSGEWVPADKSQHKHSISAVARKAGEATAQLVTVGGQSLAEMAAPQDIDADAASAGAAAARLQSDKPHKPGQPLVV